MLGYLFFSPLADSFLKVRLTTDKKEAPPLPLWILFHWEKRILSPQSSTFEVIMLGAFLFMTWSSLRFSDVRRLNIESLVLTDVELRGMVWRSKTRSNGHPFGITCSGLCSTGSFTWLVKFLRTWDALLADSGCSTWDFLIPQLSEQGTLLSHEPLDYASALRFFREMLYTPWKRFSGPHPLEEMHLNYTLHSPKATLLSFDLSWGRRWTQMIVCNRVIMLIHGNPFICMGVIRFGGHYDINKLWSNRSGRDSVPRRHNTEGAKHSWLNLKLHWSALRNKQLNTHISIFLFLLRI